MQKKKRGERKKWTIREKERKKERKKGKKSNRRPSFMLFGLQRIANFHFGWPK
jgi:hypothetical protein